MKLLSFNVGGPQRFGVWITRAVATLTLRLGGQSSQALFNDEPLSFFAVGLSVEDNSDLIFPSREAVPARSKTPLGMDRYVFNNEPSLYSHQASRAPK
ncbi:hypothetical protein [Pseudomonas sp. DWP3-1-2]|jgi:hypothetical protein|uniref:hypothetical protein n=1 Tax=Pseudomonas sp. DWP3-1-2 TaxID=2804645 RepID=UPI003CEC6683